MMRSSLSFFGGLHFQKCRFQRRDHALHSLLGRLKAYPVSVLMQFHFPSFMQIDIIFGSDECSYSTCTFALAVAVLLSVNFACCNYRTQTITDFTSNLNSHFNQDAPASG